MDGADLLQFLSVFYPLGIGTSVAFLDVFFVPAERGDFPTDLFQAVEPWQP